MNRRQFLSIAATGAIGGLAGCLDSVRPGDGDSAAGPRTASPTATGRMTEREPTERPTREVELPIPKDELYRGAAKDAIPAITDPAFDTDWSGVAASLADDEQVIGVLRSGTARAYPLAILNWHEVVNDTFDGPLLVTYCPLCGSGVTAERLVDGEPTVFGVSGFLWKSDLVMYDRKTQSLWSQILATAIRGPKTGETLSLVPSALTTWGAWKESHPDTEVLLPSPKSSTVQGEVYRNYEQDPYAGYDSSRRIGIGFSSFDDTRLHPKAMVIGVSAGGTTRAYPLDAVVATGVINDTVGDLPVVVAVGPDDTLVAYDRRIEGETLRFEAAGIRHLRAGGSRWEITTGRAVDGPYEGTHLERANDRSPMFWFAWLDFNPETELYGTETTD